MVNYRIATHVGHRCWLLSCFIKIKEVIEKTECYCNSNPQANKLITLSCDVIEKKV